MSSPSAALPPLGSVPQSGAVQPPSPLSRSSSASVYDFSNDALSKMIRLTSWFAGVISCANVASSESLQEIGELAESCPDANECSELIAAMKLSASTKQFNENLKTMATTKFKDLYPNVELISPRIPRSPSVDRSGF